MSGINAGGTAIVRRCDSPSCDETLDGADTIDVALNEVTAEARIGPHRPFQIDEGLGAKPSERRDAERLRRDVKSNAMVSTLDDGEADAVDGDTLPQGQVSRRLRLDEQALPCRRVAHVDDPSERLNQTREHVAVNLLHPLNLLNLLNL